MDEADKATTNRATEKTEKTSATATKGRKRSIGKKTTVHVIEVFAIESEENGWLFYSPKTPKPLEEKLVALAGEVDDDEFAPVSHEPEVKAWFIAESMPIVNDDVGELGKKFEEALDSHFGDWVFCQACSEREPCRVWNLKTVMVHGYDIVETDPWGEMLSVFEDLLKNMLSSREKGIKGMSVEAAAKVLGVGWPLTQEELEKAFKRAAMRAHPDHGGNDALMRTVLTAREVLKKAMA